METQDFNVDLTEDLIKVLKKYALIISPKNPSDKNTFVLRTPRQMIGKSFEDALVNAIDNYKEEENTL